MNYRRLTLLAICLLVCSISFSQDYAFKVLANKGANEFKSATGWQPLKTGASLKETDELKVSENAYIGLVSSNGKPMELKQAGNYKVSDLAAKMNGGTSVLNKYTDFILSSNSAEAKKNRLSATGAVHRAVEKSAITLNLPPNQSSGLFNDKAIIRWTTKASGPYVVTIRNMFDDVLDQIETPETVLELDLGDKKLAAENAVLVEVSAKTDPKSVSAQYLIKKLTPSQQESIKKSLNEILGELSAPTALNKLILAGFYEENNLLIDAITSYEEAVKLAPDVLSYQEDYDEFLIRNGLKN
ncbi:MAG TPA: hypothetical protein VFW11_07370 [Cyclobacteriaceae bacterium]|nr:hypothetical protein [Cyclobacteriaceae bacterium]